MLNKRMLKQLFINIIALQNSKKNTAILMEFEFNVFQK